MIKRSQRYKDRIEPTLIDNSLSVQNSLVTSNQAFEWSLFGASSTAGVSVTEHTANLVSSVYACVEKIAVISTLPKHIYISKDGYDERVDHPYWELLNTEPGPSWTAESFWEIMIQMMLLRGDAIAEIVRKNTYSNQIIGLKPLICEQILLSKKNDRLIYQITSKEGLTKTLSQDDILHIPNFGFNGWRGMSQIRYAARNAIGISLAADGYSSEFFANGQRPDYVLQTPSKLDKEQTTQLKESLENRLMGAGNRHKPLILQGGLEVKPISLSAADTQLLETRKFQVTDVCMAFGVPPQLIGAHEAVSGWAGSSLEQLNLGFTKFTLMGHTRRIQQEINRKLFKGTPYFCEFNFDAFLQGDSASRADYFSKAVGGPGSQGWMTVQEVRKIENLPPDSNKTFDNVIVSGNNQGAKNETSIN